MTPELIVGAIRAVGEAVTEIFRFLQTAQGQKGLEHALANQVAFENAMKGAGAWLEKLFTGKLNA